ncbi:glycosyltransferase [Sphingomonas sp. PB4P5]|uniref:glycosyltransferase n=1 Tax=Parasphingomonas puruogangriensis TaxID=3096155 RepID=UPI002FC623E1
MVATSRAVCDDDDRLLSPRELRHGVTVVRTWTPRRRGGMAGRLLAYLAYYATALVQALKLAGRDTVFVVKTDPPLLPLVMEIGALRGTRLVHWVQDLFPEVAQAFGMRLGGGPSGALLRWLRDLSFRRALYIVAIGDLMAGRIAALGIPPDRIRIIPNWTDDVAITPVARHAPSLRRDWDIAPAAFVLNIRAIWAAHTNMTRCLAPQSSCATGTISSSSLSAADTWPGNSPCG